MLNPMACSFPCSFAGCYPCCGPGSEPSLWHLRRAGEKVFPDALCLVLLGPSFWLLLYCTLDLGLGPYLSVY